MHDKKNIWRAFPGIFRQEDIQCLPGEVGGFSFRTSLYHDRASIAVSFNYRKRNPGLKSGALASLRRLPEMQPHQGAVQVAGLTVLDYPAKNLHQKHQNSFQTVPHSWGVDRRQVDCACGLWDVSSKDLRRLLFSTVLKKSGNTGLH
ncbi:MAG: hypothetical protein OEV23_00565 [Gallionella sp.]|nr:hypothetical protein [Gallionella sp.]